MKALLGLTTEELAAELRKLGCPAYRAKQLQKWLARGARFAEMTDLSLGLRESLSKSYSEGYATPLQVLQSADGTKKYLLEFADGNTAECVYMPKNYGTTVCVSTQVGCAMGCVFCASCADGLVRNLTAGEILAQVIAINADNPDAPVDHIVLMGMGEPLQNYGQTLKFLQLVNSPDGLGIGKRGISLSTCGIADKIRDLAEQNFGLTLSVSLHAPNQQKREAIMPTAKQYPIGEILAAANEYFRKTGRRIIIEYALIGGFNDSDEDAAELAALLRGMNCHVNLIPLNAWGGWEAPETRRIYAFCAKLEELGISATVRKSMGADIEGACGQLKHKKRKQRERA